MRVFITKSFARFIKKQKIEDKSLCEIISEINDGNIHVDLGGGILKQRLSREGQGKSSGYRTILAFKKGNNTFFIFGFPKNVQANIDKNHLNALKKLSKELFSYNDKNLDSAIKNESLKEVFCHE